MTRSEYTVSAWEGSQRSLFSRSAIKPEIRLLWRLAEAVPEPPEVPSWTGVCSLVQMEQDLRSCESLGRFSSQEAADEAPGFGGNVLRNAELSTADFGEKGTRV